MLRLTTLGMLVLLMACGSDASTGGDSGATTGDQSGSDAVADGTSRGGGEPEDASSGDPDAAWDAGPGPEDVGVDAVADVAVDSQHGPADGLMEADAVQDVAEASPDAEPMGDGSVGEDASAGDVAPDVVEPSGPAGPCPLNERVGRFDIADHGLYAAVNGNVADGVIPLTVLQPVGEDGDCVLMMKTNPFCDPPCAAGELCNHDNTCHPFPANRDIGTVTVEGLKVPISMEPNLSNDYWDTTLPPEPWEVGAQVTFATSGGDYAPFTAEVEGVEPLVGGEPKWQVNSGEATTIEWVPADGPGRMWLTLNVDQHGITPVTLLCETEDTGSVTISAEMVDQFIAFGVTGFAVGQLRRRSIDSIVIEPGCVEVSLYSPWVAQPVVEGHTPCNGDFDCPEGQKCNIFINTCVDG